MRKLNRQHTWFKWFLCSWVVLGLHLFVAIGAVHAATDAARDLLILCYHSIQVTAPDNDGYTLTRRRFTAQMEYLRAHGYTPISVQTLQAAVDGKQRLPEKAVLLTFDDAYRSYHDFVVPILDLYGFPSMLAVVGSWIENGPPQGLAEPLMTWEQIRQVAKNPLVTVASHSFDLHRAVRYTPQGNVAAVVAVRAYDADNGYEPPEAYRAKLDRDFERQARIFEERLGRTPAVMVWPYGRYNETSVAVATRNGLALNFCLDDKDLDVADPAHPDRLNRMMVTNQPIDLFIYRLQHLRDTADPIRAVQVDLDQICEPDNPGLTDRNLGRLIDRLVAMKINTVFLQAFADPDGDGNASSAYFHNRELPVRADIFAHATHQLHFRGIRVYAWLPVLSYVFPDQAFNQRYRVRAFHDGQSGVSPSWYTRLTPFSEQVAERISRLYADLATTALISGVLFQDDAYLNDIEDTHPLALEAFGTQVGQQVSAAQLGKDGALAQQWVDFKTRALNEFIRRLMAEVRRFRPEARFGRNIYARPVITPRAQAWFAQNYEQFLEAYDHVVVMAYPRMEKQNNAVAWLRELVRAAGRPIQAQGQAQPNELWREKTVFKLQAYDWREKQWIPDRELLRQMRAVLAAGGRNLAYYPDNPWDNRPDMAVTGLEMSTRRQAAGE